MRAVFFALASACIGHSSQISQLEHMSLRQLTTLLLTSPSVDARLGPAARVEMRRSTPRMDFGRRQLVAGVSTLAMASPFPVHARKAKISDEQAALEAALASLPQDKPLSAVVNWKPGDSIADVPKGSPDKYKSMKSGAGSKVDEDLRRTGVRTMSQVMEDGYDCRNTWSGCNRGR